MYHHGQLLVKMGVLLSFFWGRLQTIILPISPSLVAGIIGRGHHSQSVHDISIDLLIRKNNRSMCLLSSTILSICLVQTHRPSQSGENLEEIEL